MTDATDRIEKRILLRAARARVWNALVDSKAFGAWFGMKFDAPFQPGARMKGTMTPAAVDADVAKMQEPFDGMPFEITIDRIEPEKVFSFRWHPHAVDAKHDYTSEPTTLVVFEIAEAAGGIELTVTESGFDRLPAARRATALRANEGGWAMVVQLIGKYLAQQS